MVRAVCLKVEAANYIADGIFWEESAYRIDDIDDSVVAARSKDGVTIGVTHEEKLFMAEIVRNRNAILLIVKALTVMAIKIFAVKVIVEDKKSRSNFNVSRNLVDKMKAAVLT